MAAALRPAEPAAVREGFDRMCAIWIDLPVHPHVPFCHHVRRLDGSLCAFLEVDQLTGRGLLPWLEQLSEKEQAMTARSKGQPFSGEQRLTQRSDVWSWGATVLHLLTGQAYAERVRGLPDVRWESIRSRITGSETPRDR